MLIRRNLERIAQRLAKQRHVNFKHVTVFRLEAIPKADAIRSKEVDVDIARAAEEIVFEVVVFQVGHGMAHVRLEPHHSTESRRQQARFSDTGACPTTSCHLWRDAQPERGAFMRTPKTNCDI